MKLWLLALLIPLPAFAATAYDLVYVGTYTDRELLVPSRGNAPGERSKGIYAFRFDPDTGRLTSLGLAAETPNPTYVTFSQSGRVLYAANEIYKFQGEETGTVSAFAIDPATGRLTLLNQTVSRGTGPCHLSVDHTGNNLLVANFGSGSAAVLPLNADGTLRPASAVVQDTGTGPNPRQAGPHTHSFNVSPDNRLAIAAEFGSDRLMLYRFDAAAGSLRPAEPPFVAMAPASAPRHFTFHPNGKVAYAVNEIDNTVTALTYDAAAGTLRVLQTLSTLPSDFKAMNTAAEVLVHPSGKFLYASNRGLHSIAVFAIDEAGRLRLLANVPSGGRTPRGFSLDPTGHWLIAANQDTHNLAVFAIDPATGLPAPTGQSLEVRTPTGVKFLPVAN
ncbi:MAG TPA: lactonase family protein [Opitutaceae bacterium]|nr:lactonase family protein [Opitutaceae bacterium]